MKCYIDDKSYSGADIFFSEDDEKAYAYFYAKNYPYWKKLMDDHNYEKSGPNNPWIKYVKQYEGGEWKKNIEIFEIVDGLDIQTDGE